MTACKPLSILIRNLNIHNTIKIDLNFDPFFKNQETIRQCLQIFTQKKQKKELSDLVIKTSVHNNRCEPMIGFTLSDGHKLMIKTLNLNSIDIEEIQTKIDTKSQQKIKEKIKTKIC
ncbi:unnamed protein product [Gordionus sp. m RMFG-2023]